MAPELVLEIMNQSLVTATYASLPYLAASLIVGILFSIIQALTQIQENTLTFVPKIIAVFGVMAISTQFVGTIIADFAYYLFALIRHPSGL